MRVTKSDYRVETTPDIHLIIDLNGSTVFSKIDLNQCYHQLELEETPEALLHYFGSFWCKRISFEIHFAAEIFQKSIEDVLQGVKGTRNTSERHNSVWQEPIWWLWLSTSCPSENERKQFNWKPWQVSVQPTIHWFLWPSLLCRRHQCRWQKRSSLINASPPKNAPQARSFLGLAQYLTHFIKDVVSISAPVRQLKQKYLMGLGTRRATCLYLSQGSHGHSASHEVFQPLSGNRTDCWCQCCWTRCNSYPSKTR